MNRKNFIIGTAGHVDHGKTALIKALTNIECDTHKEEKSRGITINLGFAHISHPKGYEIGIIDVPGHKDFISTMIRGASGINFVLFVIAADSGIMPQTREHLQIINALGIENGIIVLTKIDLVENELLELAKEEIIELFDKTSLKNAAICEVSAKTGFGIENLKEEIFKLIDEIKNNPADIDDNSPFIMNIDRTFTIKGKGTIVAGSSRQGFLKLNDPVYLLPDRNFNIYKIRSIQKYNSESFEVNSGERAALNISNIKTADVKNITVLSNFPLRAGNLADASISFFDTGKKNQEIKVKSSYKVRLLIGSQNTQAKIHILFNKIKQEISESEQLLTSDNCEYYVQIKFEKSCITKFGDRFIIRNSSDDKTIGFGIILDPAPLIHRKKTEKLFNAYKMLSEKGLMGIIEAEVIKNRGLTDIDSIAVNQNLSKYEVSKLINDNNKEILFLANSLIVDKKLYIQQKKIIPNIIRKYHLKLPLSEKGMTIEALTNTSGLSLLSLGYKLTETILSNLEKENIVKNYCGTWILSSHRIQISKELEIQISQIEKFILSFDMTFPLNSQISEYAALNKISDSNLYQILKHLTGLGKLCYFEESYIHSSIVDKCREKLLNYLKSNPGKGITVAEFRDIVNGNRKICLLLLGIYDKEKTTVRNGDYRKLFKD